SAQAAAPCCGSSGYGPIAPTPAPGSAASPCTRTITVYERVPEYYETTRTTYRTEQVQETYTAYRHECVPETRTRTKTVYRQVQEWKDVTSCTYKCVPTMETRTTYKKVRVCKEVTTCTRKCVDQGHWEERCVECKPMF